MNSLLQSLDPTGLGSIHFNLSSDKGKPSKFLGPKAFVIIIEIPLCII